ncbi:MAG: hypothetical protein IKL35_08880 [Muribaculaceae bacterium]|nr:hypothetical protein [Muribaculaceae bacterium]
MKHFATIIFYENIFPGEDAKRLKRIARMIRRENLLVVEEKYEHIPCKFDDLLKAQSTSLVEIPGAVEERYFVTFEAADPKRLHALVAWLQAYAVYCGTCSRLFRWSSQ